MGITWDDRTMGTGVPEIDAQHRDLIRHLNGFIEAMKAGQSQHELQELIRYLGQYAAAHFRHEEGCMRRVKCPAAQANEAAHKHFMAVFQDIAEQIDLYGPKTTLVLRVQRELGDWIRSHIIGCDTKLRQCAGSAV